MSDLKRNYYAIIPANVRYDKRLKANAKLLYGEITALSNEKGYCWASDKYFMDLYGVSRISIQNWLKSLEENGYIKREVTYKEGSKEIDTRYITILNNPSKEIFTTPSKEKFTDNNTSFNNTNNNTNNNNMSSKPDRVPYKEIIDYLNEKVDTKYRHQTKATQEKIKARFKEGFTLDDFKTVIDKKINEWSSTDMSKYLRPETLFGTKFESYLNQQTKTNKQRSGGYDTSEYDNLF